MKRGGTGGANTQTGAVFEQQTNLVENLEKNNYNTLPTTRDFNKVYKDGILVGYQGKQASLYNFLYDEGVYNCRTVNAVNYRPDEWFYNITNDTWYIIEKKQQSGSGSTVHKLMACSGLKFCYERLFAQYKTTSSIQMIYQLSSWHDDPKHQDYFDYFEHTGTKWFFNDVPMSALGL